MIDKNNLILTGNNVYLRPIGGDDLKHLQKWGNDPEIMMLTGEVSPMSDEDVDCFFQKIQNDNNRLWFVIVIKQNEQVIGEAGLLRMFKPWNTTDLTIIIGEKDAWGKGYGTEAITLLLDYTFEQLGFHRVSVGVVGFNERAIGFYKKIGFKQEGVQRDGYYSNNKYSDFIMMSILDEEFREYKAKCTRADRSEQVG